MLDWKKEQLKSIDIRTRKLMTMNGSLHPRGNVGKGGIGFISCEECVNVEVQDLDKYLSNNEEWMLKFVAGEKRLSEVGDPDPFKKQLKEEKRIQWL